MEIDSFTRQSMDCFVSDNTFAEFIGVSPRTIRSGLALLESEGLVENKGFDGRKRHLRSTLMRQALPPDAANVAEQYGKPCLTMRQALPSKSANVAEEKNKEKNTEKNSEKIVHPWEDAEWLATWNIWLQDRRDRNIKRYTLRGEQAALHKLYIDCGGDVQIAIEAVKNSIAHGYQGIFPPKGKSKPTFDSQKFDDWVNS